MNALHKAARLQAGVFGACLAWALSASAETPLIETYHPEDIPAWLAYDDIRRAAIWAQVDMEEYERGWFPPSDSFFIPDDYWPVAARLAGLPSAQAARDAADLRFRVSKIVTVPGTRRAHLDNTIVGVAARHSYMIVPISARMVYGGTTCIQRLYFDDNPGPDGRFRALTLGSLEEAAFRELFPAMFDNLTTQRAACDGHAYSPASNMEAAYRERNPRPPRTTSN